MRSFRLVQEWRERVRARARGLCEYCRAQERFALQSFSVEHIVPLSSGGTNDFGNLALSCQGCNNHKYIKTSAVDPATGVRERLFNPRLDKWEEHFAWSDSYAYIQGVTPIGRATVEALRLNRDGLVNLRIVLRSQGLHPPGRPEPLPPN